jgi:hypothetical protein
MSSKRRFAELFVWCSIFALPAAAQLNSATLHAKYGAPLDRETFHMPAGFDLVVDYGPNSQVCRLQVPALMPTTEQVRNSHVMNRRMYEFLSELVPDSMRGKETGRMIAVVGAPSIESIEYEHVTISQLNTVRPFNSEDNVITVTFTNQNCQAVAPH